MIRHYKIANFHASVAFGMFVVLSAAELHAQQSLPAEGDEAKLIAILQSDADVFDKAKACQRLAVIGSDDAVPVLKAMLADAELAHYARFALEPMADPAVDAALRAAMNQLDGQLKIGVINSLGVRRDAGAVPSLIQLLRTAETPVASAAAVALGKIATPEAVAALQNALGGPEALQVAVADACLTAADRALKAGRAEEAIRLYNNVRDASPADHVQVAALVGLVRVDRAEAMEIVGQQLQANEVEQFRVGLYAAQRLDGSDVTTILVNRADDLRPERKALVLAVLAARGDKAALPFVRAAAQEQNSVVRSAATGALASLGDASAVPLLLKTAVEGEGELAETAFDGLARLTGEGVDEALASALSTSAGDEQLVLIRLIGRRGIDSAVSTLLDLADSDHDRVQRAAIAALGTTVRLGSLPALIDRLTTAKTPEVRSATKEALQKAVLRMPDRDAVAGLLIEAMEASPAAVKADLLDLLGLVGGKRALQAVSAAARHENEELQDAATRVLGTWLSPEAAPVLLDLARSDDHRFRTRALRGYIRIIRQFDLPADERRSMAKQALEVAERDQEKRLVLETLTRFPSPQALELAAGYLDEPSLHHAASQTAVTIAEEISNGDYGGDREALVRAMEKVVEVSEDDELKTRAKMVLSRGE